MKNKNIIILSMLATMLLCGSFISSVAAQEDKVDPTREAVDPSVPPDAGLIAPVPEDNATSSDDDPILYYTTGENLTAVDDTLVPGAEDANLIATNTSEGLNNTLLIAAIAVLSVVVAAAAVGVVHYRRSASKQQI
jgi:hypothetical protein